LEEIMKKWLGGVAAAVVSGVLIFWLTQVVQTVRQKESHVSDTYSSRDNFKQSPARIRISYSIGSMEEGRAIVYIDGREVGSLYVDNNKKNSAIDVTLPKPGSYEYSVHAIMTIMGIIDLDTGLELPFENESNGRGTIEVEDGKEFILSTNNLALGGGGRNTFYASLSDKSLQ
jgi:hypothetical protein